MQIVVIADATPVYTAINADFRLSSIRLVRAHLIRSATSDLTCSMFALISIGNTFESNAGKLPLTKAQLLTVRRIDLGRVSMEKPLPQRKELNPKPR